MDESKNEVLVSELHDSSNPYKDYLTVAEKKVGKWLIKVTTDGVDINREQANRLINNTYKAAQISSEINNGPIGGYEEELILRFPKKGIVGLMNDLKARKELLTEDDDSQIAAVIHEMIHAIEIDITDYHEMGMTQETVTLVTEFIFGGESRRPYFLYLTEEVINNARENKMLDEHSLGWKKSLQMLSASLDVDIDLMDESAKDIIIKLDDVRNFEESKKVALARNFINQGKVVSDKV